jgi:DNA-binding SARP family transcriptional activator
LALLAILAAAGNGGVSRDKLLEMLWPEGDPAKSRHALNQIISAQRRHFGDDNLFDGRKTVRFNSKAITSDVAALECALAANDLDSVTKLYSGPFLDGFFVPDSPEFEMWVSATRARYSNRVSETLECAAANAIASGDAESAVKWRRHALEIDPLDVSRALRLADALVLANNRAGALRVLETSQQRLNAELGVTSDPALAKRIDALKRELTSQRG